MAIVAIVAVVGLVSLFNSGIVKIEADDLSGEAANLKKIVDISYKNITSCAEVLSETNNELTVCSSDLTTCNNYLTDCATVFQTNQNELTVCQENLASSIQISTLCTSFPEACGCTDEDFSNYDALAIIDDGSCSNNIALLFNGYNSVRSLDDNKIQHPPGDPFILSYFIKKTGTGTGIYPRIVSLSYWPNSGTSFETAIKSSNNKVSWWSGMWHDSTIGIQDDVVYFVKWEYTGEGVILTITDWESQQTDTQTWSDIAGTIDFDGESIYIGDNPESDTFLDFEGFEGVIEQVRLRSYTNEILNEILTYMFNEGSGDIIHDFINDYDGVIISDSTENMWVEGLP